MQTLQRADYVFKFKMLSRNTCCKLISRQSQTKSVGGLHVSLSDWLARNKIYFCERECVFQKRSQIVTIIESIRSTIRGDSLSANSFWAIP